MNSRKTFLLFLWHMHQPLYRDPLTERYILPWVRLHGAKDYLDMALILEDFPSIRQNFNVVPSLLMQIRDYTEGKADDIFLELSLKPAGKLTMEERIFIIENFFLANWDNLIRPLPRYHDLLMKRGVRFSREDAARIAGIFTEQEITDIQTLFNLAWIDPMFRGKDPDLRAMETKGAHFSESDKHLVMEKQMEILKGIIPAYRRMHEDGMLELSVTPFFHPILPLLCDTDSALEAMPGTTLPAARFRHPEDADAQVRLAIQFFEEVFGFRPAGMWPSEGSVSPESVELIRKNGIKWIATDEAILSASLDISLRDGDGRVVRPDLLYVDYEINGISILFRDHGLSDLIGFVYSSWDPEKAARDFHDRLVRIHSESGGHAPAVVPVILDGENAWEYYRNDGHDFLNALYSLLHNDERFECLTISDYLRRYGRRRRLENLRSGSWINGNFAIWIGHEEDNRAWDYIYRTRKDLVSERTFSGSTKDEAWMHLFAAEGSDWFWWYGDDHATDSAREFDELFRNNLMAVYRSLGREVPDFLQVPVLREDRSIQPALPIRGFITPVIDGMVTSYFEWLEGTYMEVGKSGGSMHKSESIITRIYYGFNADTLFIRADGRDSLKDANDCNCISIHFVRPSWFRATAGTAEGRLYRKKKDSWEDTGTILEYAMDEIFEIAIPFKAIEASEGDEIAFYLTADIDGQQLERYPWRGHVSLHVPPPDFDAMMWY